MGSYSVCKRCVHKATNTEYAVKVGLLTMSQPRLLGWGEASVALALWRGRGGALGSLGG